MPLESLSIVGYGPGICLPSFFPIPRLPSPVSYIALGVADSRIPRPHAEPSGNSDNVIDILAAYSQVYPRVCPGQPDGDFFPACGRSICVDHVHLGQEKCYKTRLESKKKKTFFAIRRERVVHTVDMTIQVLATK